MMTRPSRDFFSMRMQIGAILSGERCDGVDGVVRSFVVHKIGADIGGERGIVGGDGNVPAAASLRPVKAVMPRRRGQAQAPEWWKSGRRGRESAPGIRAWR